MICECSTEKLNENAAVKTLMKQLTDKIQLIPQPIKSLLLLFIEHQSTKLIVLSIEQRKRDHFIDRNDLGVAQRGRE